MKTLYRKIFLYAAIAMFASACYKDNGNYSYKEDEEITITGIEPSYTKISNMDRITLDPEVKSNDPKASFSYFWGIYETNVQGSVPKLDTIARTKAIDYLVVQPAKGWVLVFGAKNDNTGYTAFKTSAINVVTQYTRGWYVIKDDGTKSDLDLFLTPNTIAPESKIENVFSSLNGGVKLNGTAMQLNFFTDYKSEANGALGNTRAMFLVSSADATVVNINTLNTIKDFDGLFYVAPEVKRPQFVCYGPQANFFVNDGGVHGIYSMSANIGKFGGRQLRDDINSPYNLSKYYITNSFYNSVFFDEMSTSFVSSAPTASVMTKETTAAGSEMSVDNTNKNLLYMGTKSAFPYVGYAVMQDKTDPTLKILSMLEVSTSGYSVKISNDTLDVASKLYNAEQYTLIYTDESLMYFSIGREIWSRNLSNGFEQLQYTLPVGETLTFMRHKKYTGSNAAEMPYYYNYVMIGSKSGGNYKVRMFGKTSGNLNPEPAFVLEGAGAAGDVIYIAPLISGTTYQNSY